MSYQTNFDPNNRVDIRSMNVLQVKRFLTHFRKEIGSFLVPAKHQIPLNTWIESLRKNYMFSTVDPSRTAKDQRNTDIVTDFITDFLGIGLSTHPITYNQTITLKKLDLYKQFITLYMPHISKFHSNSFLPVPKEALDEILKLGLILNPKDARAELIQMTGATSLDEQIPKRKQNKPGLKKLSKKEKKEEGDEEEVPRISRVEAQKIGTVDTKEYELEKARRKLEKLERKVIRATKREKKRLSKSKGSRSRSRSRSRSVDRGSPPAAAASSPIPERPSLKNL